MLPMDLKSVKEVVLPGKSYKEEHEQAGVFGMLAFQK